MKIRAKDVLQKKIEVQARTIKFVAYAVEWYNRGVGSYFSVRIVRQDDGATLRTSPQRGYGDYYKQMALAAMNEAGWLPEEYKKAPYLYERDNDYPIEWRFSNGTKREMLRNIEE